MADCWLPPILRQLGLEYSREDIHFVGIEVLGYPPEVFGVTYDELKRLSESLAARKR